MSAFDVRQSIGEIVAQNPGLSRVFEAMGIDYCCGGKQILAEACQRLGLNPQVVLLRLEEENRSAVQNASAVDLTAMSLIELVDHIEKTHHAYLHEELPRLAAMTRKVAAKHGKADPRLRQVQEIFSELVLELSQHMFKEEQRLFPMIRLFEASDQPLMFHCGSLANPIRQMESEHDDVGAALKRLRELTDGFAPPAWACNTYRALLAGLAYLERDTHTHVHKENSVLFPRVLETESRGFQTLSSS